MEEWIGQQWHRLVTRWAEPGHAAAAVSLDEMRKPLGLLLMSWALVKLRLGQLSSGVNWTQMVAISVMSGLGFTMAVFINELAFDDAVVRDQAKLGILFASLVAGGLGVLLFRFGPAASRP